MAAFAEGCDAVVHFAGMNRGDDQVLYATNLALTRTLLEACAAAGARPHLVFSSSTHVERETAYGRSKRACGQLMGEWAARNGARFTELILPHVFGEGGLPFYNSVVSTFCHQLARGEPCSVDPGAEVEPLHAQAVCRSILDLVRSGHSGRVRLEGRRISVKELHASLAEMAADYAAQIVPDLRDPFRRDLFNTYRSCLFPDHYPVALRRHSDPRGSLVETVKARQGGQSFISDTRPGITRGNHYHTRKFERFLVLAGEAEIRLRRLESGEIHRFPVSGEAPCYVDMPTFHTHCITNTGSGLLVTLFWSSEIFDPNDPDTFMEPVGEAPREAP
jgi:UDP-2-acetamido-2,6-beta-L-arabino-hexul-4-ose reductase